MKRLVVSLILSLALLATLGASVASAAPARPALTCDDAHTVRVMTIFTGYYTSPNGHFYEYSRLQGLGYPVGAGYAICYLQAVQKIHNNTGSGRYLHYFIAEIDDGNGNTLPGGQAQWLGPGGTGDAYVAAGADYYFYGPWVGIPCNATYKPWVWIQEGSLTGSDYAGLFGAALYMPC